MTCIVGVEHKGRVWIGADSAGVDAWLNRDVRDARKVFRIGEVVIGFTGSFRWGQTLQYRLTVPPIQTWDIYRWCAIDFMDAVRAAAKEAGVLSVSDSVETGHELLLGVRGYLFYCGSDLQIGRSVTGYSAVGCGYMYALGAMAALGPPGPCLAPDTLLTRALGAAATHNAGVCEPFTILSTEHQVAPAAEA